MVICWVTTAVPWYHTIWFFLSNLDVGLTIASFITGYHSLYQWYRSVESEHFPDPTGLRARIEQWTFGLYPACIKYLMSAFDVPEVRKSTSLNHWDSFVSSVLFSFFTFVVTMRAIVRLWLLPGIPYARMGWHRSPEGVQLYTTLPSSFITGSSPLLLFPWCLEATCTFALIGFTYTSMKPFPRFALPITRHSLASISNLMAILRFSPLQ